MKKIFSRINRNLDYQIELWEEAKKSNLYKTKK